MEAIVTQKKTKKEPATLTEYSVEFESVSKFLAYFKEEPGLTDAQVIEKALKIADTALGGGQLTIERTNPLGGYAFTALGVDSTTAHILGRPVLERPKLRLVK